MMLPANIPAGATDLVNRMIGEISRQDLVKVRDLARKRGFPIMAGNITMLLLRFPAFNTFEIEEIDQENFVEETVLNGFEFDSDPDPDSLGKGGENIYQEITDLIINTIEKNEGKLIWEKPWSGAHTFGRVMNFVSRKPYRGINSLLLEIIYPLIFKRNWKNPFFMSRTQVKNKKGSIRKGAEGYPIIFYTVGYRYINEQENVEIVAYDKQKFIEEVRKVKHRIKAFKSGKLSLSHFADQHSFSMVKRYKVFNGEDIEGIDWKLDQVKIKTTFTPIEAAEEIIDKMPKRPKITHGGDGAYYVPSRDVVNMPERATFKKEQYYYSTKFHELVHSTGHQSRLGRNLTGGRGSEEYAFEELIAELGAAFISAECGMLNHHIKNTAAYIEGWNERLIKKMKQDKTFIFRASAKAQDAADFIMDVNKAGVPKYRRSVKKKKKDPLPEPKVRKKVSAKINKPSVKQSVKPAAKQKPAKDTGQYSLFGAKGKGLSGPVRDLPPLFVRPGQTIEKQNVFRLPGVMGDLFGELQKYKLAILLTGDPHAGKSEFVFQLEDAFFDFGFSVGHFDIEQGGLDAKPTQESIARNIKPKNVDKLAVAGEAPEGFETIRQYAPLFDVLIVDSWQKLNVPNTWIDKLRSEFPETIFVIISQQNSEGGTRGGVSADYDVPVAIKVHKMDNTFVNNYAEVWKNRGNVTGIRYNLAERRIIPDLPEDDETKNKRA